MRPRDDEPISPLTPREMEVLRQLAMGRDVRGISRELGISVNTCRSYVKALLAKLEVHSQLEAVVAHEEAHLRGRHDLLLEFFSVVHSSVPEPLRSPPALGEVRLLVEALADRAAVRRSGEVATARALMTLAGSRAPEAALGVGTTAPVRLRLLADGPPHPVLPVIAYSYATLAATLPLLLLGLAWA